MTNLMDTIFVVEVDASLIVSWIALLAPLVEPARAFASERV
jgi:hypothetical protein